MRCPAAGCFDSTRACGCLLCQPAVPCSLSSFQCLSPKHYPRKVHVDFLCNTSRGLLFCPVDACRRGRNGGLVSKQSQQSPKRKAWVVRGRRCGSKMSRVLGFKEHWHDTGSKWGQCAMTKCRRQYRQGCAGHSKQNRQESRTHGRQTDPKNCCSEHNTFIQGYTSHVLD